MIEKALEQVIEYVDMIRYRARRLEQTWQGCDEETTKTVRELIDLSNKVNLLIEGDRPCNLCRNQPPLECNGGGHCVLPKGHDGEHSYA